MSSWNLSRLLREIAEVEYDIEDAERAKDWVEVERLEVVLGELETDLESFDAVRGYWRDEE